MGASSSASATSPVDASISRLASSTPIDSWSDLLSTPTPLLCQDPTDLSEAILRHRSALMQNNTASQNVQSLAMRAISLLRDAKDKKAARYQAANALNILRTIIVLTSPPPRGSNPPFTLFHVPLSSTSSDDPPNYRLFSALIQHIIQALVEAQPGSDTLYCLLTECTLFLTLSASPSLYSSIARSPGSNPFLDALLDQGKEMAGPLIEKLLGFIIDRPRPHSSEQPWQKKASDLEERERQQAPPRPYDDDDDILASAAELIWMPFEGSAKPKTLFSVPRSLIPTLPVSPDALKVELGDLALSLLVLLLRLPDNPPMTLNYYRNVLASLLDESSPPVAPAAEEPSVFARLSSSGGGQQGRASNPGNLPPVGPLPSFLGSSAWSFGANKAGSAPALLSFPPPPPPPPRAYFTTLLAHLISRGHSDELGTCLLYSLVISNEGFKKHALSLSEGPGGVTLVLHLIKCLHHCPRPATSFSFVLQALLLIVTEDPTLSLALCQHTLDAKAVSFYSEGVLEAPVNLSSLLMLTLLRTIFAHFSLSTDPSHSIQSRGSRLPTNALAAVSNLAPHLSNLHPQAAGKIISSLQSLSRMREKVTNELQTEYGRSSHAQINSLLANLTIITDYMSNVLSAVLAMASQSYRNPQLVYELLARQEDLLIPLLNANTSNQSQLVGSSAFILELVSSLLDLTQFFDKQLRGQSHGRDAKAIVVREESEALKLIVSASQHYHPVQRGKGTVRKEARWLYVEDPRSADFFLPYVFSLILPPLPVLWPVESFPLLSVK